MVQLSRDRVPRRQRVARRLFHWLDYMSWYPALGRPIGTTIYPGMQITAARSRPPPPAAVSAAALEPLPVSESRQLLFESATARARRPAGDERGRRREGGGARNGGAVSRELLRLPFTAVGSSSRTYCDVKKELVRVFWHKFR